MRIHFNEAVMIYQMVWQITGLHQPLEVLLLMGIVLFSLLLSGLALFGGTQWPWVLVSHFRFQILLLSLLSLFFAFLKRRSFLFRFLTLLLLMVTVLNAQSLSPYLIPRPVTGSSQPRLTLMQINLWKENQNQEAVETWIRLKHPDILSLQELTPWWREHLLNQKWLKQAYPIRLVSDASETGLLSRFPLQSLHFEPNWNARHDQYWQGFITGKLWWQGELVTLIALHTANPSQEAAYQLQLDQVENVIQLKKQFSQSRILIGDLNATPWTHPFERYTRELALFDAALGKGYLATWPTYFPVIGVPIDHVLLSEDWRVVQFELGPGYGPGNGSDHASLYLEVQRGEVPRSIRE